MTIECVVKGSAKITSTNYFYYSNVSLKLEMKIEVDEEGGEEDNE